MHIVEQTLYSIWLWLNWSLDVVPWQISVGCV